ncbi:MAG: KamA family radical SAM protein [Deltaproteobacteria bacterium]|nr:KamA family radical SAM protein [Deltaproteobacteria bacterium]
MPTHPIDPTAPWSAFGGTAEQWADWRWQQRNSIKTLAQLEKHLELTDDERRGVDETAKIFRLGISPYYLSLCDAKHPFCPVRMQAVPTRAEARINEGELEDPLGEDKHRPVPAIVHRYPDRVLFLALDRCSVYCRHCTRRRMTGSDETDLGKDEIAQGIEYVRAHPEVRDVLISGGDPFLLATQKLEGILAGLRAIPHVQMIRIGTRVPVCLPQRVDAELCDAIRKHHPVFVVTHFNHPKELTPEAKAASARLVDAGIPVENQCVLLRRVNSTARTMKELSHRLLMTRVRPYYMHQADVAEGIEHLRTPLAKGVEILEQLRGHTSGLAVPHLAIDLPGGGGKVTLQPNYLLAIGEKEATFRNYRNEIYRYPEPAERDCSCPYDEIFYGQ